ncbi:DUF308 domain-containing protein [Micromonospora sp. NPDC049559]|uniref:DUF308 domain-containing protein n=1 Tax=Micromonospora sp. NPDC049559 TaxID=3155923 RepID=UPI0034191C3F
MVRIPSLSRRAETVPTREESRDGRVDERDPASTETIPVREGRVTDPERDADGSAYRSRHANAAPAPEETTRASAPVATAPAATTERPVADGTEVTTDLRRDRPGEVDREPPATVPAGPRPRTSLLATLGLIFGVSGALFVLTGALAGYGIALGAVAVLLSAGGMSATGRRHVAGKADAMIGLLLGLGAIVVGVLALTGQTDWPNTDTDAVSRFREWLDSQFVDRF